MDQLVVSRTLTEANASVTTLVHGEAIDHVPTARDALCKELLVIGSAHLTATFARGGVLDEPRVMVCPIVLGRGRSLFEDLDVRIALTLRRVCQFASGTFVLTYRPTPRAS
jgi:dihydrofolate reductase